jgi:hypothetical protein
MQTGPTGDWRSNVMGSGRFERCRLGDSAASPDAALALAILAAPVARTDDATERPHCPRWLLPQTKTRPSRLKNAECFHPADTAENFVSISAPSASIDSTESDSHAGIGRVFSSSVPSCPASNKNKTLKSRKLPIHALSPQRLFSQSKNAALQTCLVGAKHNHSAICEQRERVCPSQGHICHRETSRLLFGARVGKQVVQAHERRLTTID